LARHLYIHIGFTKCGSSTIQRSLVVNQNVLRQAGFLLVTEDLTLNKDRDARNTPLRRISEMALAARKESRPDVVPQFIKLLEDAGDASLILSSENLSNPPIARLFEGIDKHTPVTVICYIRPQFDWIPSAWKQWGLKDGTSLASFIKKALQKGRPTYLQTLLTWEKAAPNATIRLRLMHKDFMAGNDIVDDFIHLLDSPNLQMKPVERRNASFDYSILFTLAKNPSLFDNPHDHRIYSAFERALPNKYLATNMELLNQEDMNAIESHFRGENETIIKKYIGGSDRERDGIYNKVFRPREISRSFQDVSEQEVRDRLLRILLETIDLKEKPPSNRVEGKRNNG
jgi:hypothetical protein